MRPRAPFAAPFATGDFSGSVATGASCNCRTITLTPHCNGTHTECAAHLTLEPLDESAIGELVDRSAIHRLSDRPHNGWVGAHVALCDMCSKCEHRRLFVRPCKVHTGEVAQQVIDVAKRAFASSAEPAAFQKEAQPDCRLLHLSLVLSREERDRL